MFKKLITWSEAEFSHLPWRKRRSLYGTLVSEIMLQQTTVGTVLNHFDRFIKEYPNIKTLSLATEDQICISWRGLGYYRRARNLLRAAQFIEQEFQGEIPLDRETLLTIPGIGEYTASALISVGGDQPELSVDANLERVLARYYGIKIEKGPKLLKEIRKRYESGELLPKLKQLGPRKLNEALMDLGRTFCQARKVECQLCPLKKNCVATKKNPLQFPIVKEKKKAQSHELVLLRVMIKERGKVLGYTKGEKEWLSGQIEIPTFVLSCDDKDLTQYPKLRSQKAFDKLPKIKGAITKYKITNLIWETSKKEFLSLAGVEQKKYKFFKLDLREANFSSTTLKAFKKVGWDS